MNITQINKYNILQKLTAEDAHSLTDSEITQLISNQPGWENDEDLWTVLIADQLQDDRFVELYLEIKQNHQQLRIHNSPPSISRPENIRSGVDSTKLSLIEREILNDPNWMTEEREQYWRYDHNPDDPDYLYVYGTLAANKQYQEELAESLKPSPVTSSSETRNMLPTEQNQLTQLLNVRSETDFRRYESNQKKALKLEQFKAELYKNVSKEEVDSFIQAEHEKMSKPAGGDMDFSGGLDEIKFNWICQDLNLAPRDSCALVAESFTGKTYLACYLALCFLTGKPIFDKFNVDRSGLVAHLNWDSDPLMTKSYYLRLGNGMGLDLKTMKLGLYYEQPNWLTTDDCAFENLKKICTGRVICIIDSLRTSFAGDENSSEAAEVVKMLNRVTSETGCFILVIAHPGKGGVGNSGINCLRGTSSLGQTFGFILTLEQDGDNRILKQEKNRIIKAPPLTYTFKETGEFIKEIKRTSSVEMELVSFEFNDKEKVKIKPEQNIRRQIIELMRENKEMIKADLLAKVTGDTTLCSSTLVSMIKEGIFVEFKKEGSQKRWCKPGEGWNDPDLNNQ